MMLCCFALSPAITAIWLVILATCPEPDSDPDIKFKKPYRQLANFRFVVICLLVSVISQVATYWVTESQKPLWLAYGSGVGVLVATDAVTTWLPNRLMHCSWGLCAAALAFEAIRASPQYLVEPLIGSLALSAALWLAWRLGRNFGFGDVRLGIIVGALAGSGGFDFWWYSIILSAMASCMWGLATLLWRRIHPSPLGKVFAYGPGMWLGPYLALATTTLV